MNARAMQDVGTGVDATANDRCATAVTTADGWPARSCARRGVHGHAGKRYCTQHHPPRVAKKEAARKKKWDVQWEESQRQGHLRDLRDAVAAVALADPFDAEALRRAVAAYRRAEARADVNTRARPRVQAP